MAGRYPVGRNVGAYGAEQAANLFCVGRIPAEQAMLAQVPELAGGNTMAGLCLLQRCVDGLLDPEILGPAGAGRQHEQIPPLLLEHVERMHMADHGDVGADLAEVIG